MSGRTGRDKEYAERLDEAMTTDECVELAGQGLVLLGERLQDHLAGRAGEPANKFQEIDLAGAAVTVIKEVALGSETQKMAEVMAAARSARKKGMSAEITVSAGRKPGQE